MANRMDLNLLVIPPLGAPLGAPHVYRERPPQQERPLLRIQLPPQPSRYGGGPADIPKPPGPAQPQYALPPFRAMPAAQ